MFAVPTYGFVADGLRHAGGRAPPSAWPGARRPPRPSLDLPGGARRSASSSSCEHSPPARRRSPASRPSPTACRRSAGRRRGTPQRRLTIMGTISISMFLGITYLAQRARGARQRARVQRSRCSRRSARPCLRRGFLFYVLQAFTAGILILAANTAYQDFPRLSAILARDRFMPSQFRNRGDRLVFSNGVLVLAVLACLLIYAFDANLTRLIQLYVVGVFTAFTLSQAGMVRRWMRLREGRWVRSAVINGIGAVTTGVVLVIVTITKFARGAWIVIAAMPVIVAVLPRRSTATTSGSDGSCATRHLSARRGARRTPSSSWSADLGPATLDAVGYLRALRPEDVAPAVHRAAGDVPRRRRRRGRCGAPRLGRLEQLDGWTTSVCGRRLRRYIRAIDREPGRLRDGDDPGGPRRAAWYCSSSAAGPRSG